MSLGSLFAPPRWALAFHRRHLVMVTTICVIPATERFTGQLWARPAALAVAFEIVTLVARIALIVLIMRAALADDPRIANLHLKEVARRLFGYIRGHWTHLLGEVALIAVLAVVADVFPEQIVPTLVDVGPLYWAILLGTKNLTVIPFTMIWLVAWLRHALLVTAESEPQEAPSVQR